MTDNEIAKILLLGGCSVCKHHNIYELKNDNRVIEYTKITCNKMPILMAEESTLNIETNIPEKNYCKHWELK